MMTIMRMCFVILTIAYYISGIFSFTAVSCLFDILYFGQHKEDLVCASLAVDMIWGFVSSSIGPRVSDDLLVALSSIAWSFLIS